MHPIISNNAIECNGTKVLYQLSCLVSPRRGGRVVERTQYVHHSEHNLLEPVKEEEAREKAEPSSHGFPHAFTYAGELWLTVYHTLCITQ